MGKLVSWIVLALFVLIVPLGSWYYLQTGLDYRKNAISELLVKDSLDVHLDSLCILKNKTSLLVLQSNDSIKVILDKINEQFKNSPGFQIVDFDTSTVYLKLPNDYLLELRQKYSNQDFMLLDTSLYIRNVYKNTEPEIRKLIEHMAITIPRPKETDINLK